MKAIYVYLIPIMLLLAFAVFLQFRLIQHNRTSMAVSSTQTIKLKLEELLSLLVFAETGQRGFLLTRDSTFYTQFAGAKKSLQVKLDELDPLVSSTGDSHFAEVKEVVASRISWLDSVVTTVDGLHATQYQRVFVNSKNISDRARAQINRMKSRQDQLLEKQIIENEEEKRYAFILIGVFSVLSVVLLTMAFLRLKREYKTKIGLATEAKILEDMVRRRTVEIRQINEKLNHQNKILEQKNAELTSFTFIASHDLKEPLRKIRLFGERLWDIESGRLSENGKHALDRITTSATRMQMLIDSVTNYSRFEEVNAFAETDLNICLENAITGINTSNEKKAGIEKSKLPVIKADPGQMEQLFINLLDNALKFTEGTKPLVQIRSSRITLKENPFWRISFIDNGIGFDEHYREKIFEIFQRLHPGKEYRGSGIGLAICKKIVSNHKGRITVNSQPGKGSVFTIILPENPELIQEPLSWS